MTKVAEDQREQFFADVDAAARKSIWAAVATVAGSIPKVRMVHPTWEGETLWFATLPDLAQGDPVTGQSRH